MEALRYGSVLSGLSSAWVKVKIQIGLISKSLILFLCNSEVIVEEANLARSAGWHR